MCMVWVEKNACERMDLLLWPKFPQALSPFNSVLFFFLADQLKIGLTLRSPICLAAVEAKLASL